MVRTHSPQCVLSKTPSAMLGGVLVSHKNIENSVRVCYSGHNQSRQEGMCYGKAKSRNQQRNRGIKP